MLWGQKIKVFTLSTKIQLRRPSDLRQTGHTVGALYQKNMVQRLCTYIPRVTNTVADGLSCLEHDQSINSRTINVHMKNKALAKCLRRYVKATSDYPEAMQTYNIKVFSGTITTYMLRTGITNAVMCQSLTYLKLRSPSTWTKQHDSRRSHQSGTCLRIQQQRKKMKYIPYLSKKLRRPNGLVDTTLSIFRILIRCLKTKKVTSQSER